LPVISITQELPDSPDARVLIHELDQYLIPMYPTESRYGFSVERLIEEQVVFFILRSDKFPAGCGGVKCLETEYAEVKRMYIRPAFRGQGLSKLILKHLEEYTRAQDINILRLETGIYQYEAISLYDRMGFRQIPPFGNYHEGPYNIFYEKCLTNINGV
jgi:putative acetyltransferase